MASLFQTILYQPLFNALVWLYNVIPGTDIGVAILVLTFIIKVILYPLMNTSIKAQKKLQDMQPRLQELKQRHGANKEEMTKRTLELYKEHKVNPVSSCFPVLLQIPILLALYYVLRDGLGTADFSKLYSFVQNPGSLDPVMFGLVNLATPNIILGVLAGAAQFWQSKMLMAKRPPKAAGEGGKDEDMMAMMNKQMTYFMPVITVLVGFQLPGGLMLYWLASTVLTALQQLIVFKKVNAS
ncbi:MAG: YidC/Oxa1 family membrane protein insertase [Patescibacteria group bacterium]